MALPAPTPSTMTHEQDVRGVRGGGHEGHPQREHQLLDRQDDQEALAVDLVRQQPAHHGQDEGGAQLGEDDDADERGRVREVVGIGTEDDVLHPGADVRGEGTQEDDAEGAVRQGRPCGAAAGRDGAVPVDDRILDLLQGDGAVVVLGAVVGGGRHRPMVREPPSRPSGVRDRRRSRCCRRARRRPTPARPGRSVPTPPPNCVVPGRCPRSGPGAGRARGGGAACRRW